MDEHKYPQEKTSRKEERTDSKHGAKINLRGKSHHSFFLVLVIILVGIFALYRVYLAIIEIPGQSPHSREIDLSVKTTEVRTLLSEDEEDAFRQASQYIMSNKGNQGSHIHDHSAPIQARREGDNNINAQ